jgi:hypothetical protein
MGERAFPAATEFSPGVIELQDLLGLVGAATDRTAAVESIRSRFFSDSAESQSDPEKRQVQQLKRATNVMTGLRQYGLIDGTGALTALGQTLSSLSTEEAYERLGSHILSELYGLEVLKAISDMQQRGERVNKKTLAEALSADPHNFNMPKDTTNHLILLSWLRKAGVLPGRGYSFDDARVRSLTGGVGVGTVNEWEALTRPQQVFVKTLRQMAVVSGSDEVPATEVRTQAELEFGPVFPNAQMAKAVIGPLVESGWITQSGTTGARGAKSGRVGPTPKLLDIDLELLTGLAPPTLPAEIQKRLNTPLAQISDDLKATTSDGEVDKHKRGLALELLAVRLVRDLGLNAVDFRKRSAKTGGAEVDLIAEGAQLHYSRWLVQCKNVGAKVDLTALAKEIGLAVLLKAHVVLLVSTSGFKSSVAHYADRTAETTAIQVVLVSGEVLDTYLRSGPAALRSFFHDSALQTLRLKRSQVADLQVDD